MLIRTFFLTYLVFNLLPYKNLFAQEGMGKVILSGFFIDGKTRQKLHTTVVAFVNGKSIEVGSTNENKNLNFNISTDTKEIEFRSEGYQPMKVPVVFHGQFNMKLLAGFSFLTFKNDTNLTFEDLILFCYPSDYSNDKEYEWYTLGSSGFDQTLSFGNTFKIEKTSISIPVKRSLDLQGKIVIKNSKSILDSRTYHISKGLNFIDTNTYLNRKESNYSKNINFETTSIHFQQSKYELSKSVKNVLDSIVDLLKHSPEIKIKIKGFSDNVGDIRLNNILAQYRAKAVKSYFLNQGLDIEQVMIFWEEQNKETMNTNIILDDEKLRLFRKVEINVIK